MRQIKLSCALVTHCNQTSIYWQITELGLMQVAITKFHSFQNFLTHTVYEMSLSPSRMAFLYSTKWRSGWSDDEHKLIIMGTLHLLAELVENDAKQEGTEHTYLLHGTYFYTLTDSSSDKKKNIKMPRTPCYPSMRETMAGRESVGKKYEGSEREELTEIKRQQNLLYKLGQLQGKCRRTRALNCRLMEMCYKRKTFMRENTFPHPSAIKLKHLVS